MKKLKQFRNEKGLSQREMAEKLGIIQQAYSNYENNKRKLPVEKAKEIGVILEIDWWTLYED